MISAGDNLRTASEPRPTSAPAGRLRLVEYTPEHFDLLRAAAETSSRSASLTHRPFVDYYYATSERCRLHLFLDDEGGVAGTLGVERMEFEYESRPLALSFGSNFFAFQKGAAGLLFMHWMKTHTVGVVFGGSPDTHRLTRGQKWIYFGGIKTFFLNRAYPAHDGDTALRALAKWGLRTIRRGAPLSRLAERMPREMRERVSVREEAEAADDLLPRRSPFRFRLAATADYLNWRYNTRLSFVRYRLFRVLDRGEAAGYVVINDSPTRLVVAQCDGEDAELLAHAVLLCLAEVSRGDRRPREVMLTSAHAGMQRVFDGFGFKTTGRDRPFALGSRREPVRIEPDTTNWLINFDWTDNGLRPPFLDQR